jgi:hypothetical protein
MPIQAGAFTCQTPDTRVINRSVKTGNHSPNTHRQSLKLPVYLLISTTLFTSYEKDHN